jgi:hypothetical protein
MSDSARQTVTASAWSIGGRSFAFEAPMSTPLTIGADVRITPREGASVLGQITVLEVVRAASGRVLHGAGSLIAANADGEWQRASATDVFDDAAIELAPPEFVAEWTSRTVGERGLIDVGARMQGDRTGIAWLRSAGFNRHTFLCGQSGSGKTYALGLILEKLLIETELRMVVLDPNSDYVGLANIDPGGFPDAVDQQRVAEVNRRICVFRAREGEPYRPRVRFGRLPLAMQAMLLRLDPIQDADLYDALNQTTESLPDAEYSIRDLRQLLRSDTDEAHRQLQLRIDNLGLLRWQIWAERDQPPLLDQLPSDWRAAVFDLGELPTADERTALAAALMAGLWHRRAEKQPLLIVVDEAHNVCPQDVTDTHQALAVQAAINIAAEGRKYGLYLLLSTQRPQKLQVNIVSQCENLILMHMNSLADLDYLAATFSQVPPALIRQATGFELGEGLVAGRISPYPTLFRSGRRISPEGGSDIPTTWAGRPGS